MVNSRLSVCKPWQIDVNLNEVGALLLEIDTQNSSQFALIITNTKIPNLYSRRGANYGSYYKHTNHMSLEPNRRQWLLKQSEKCGLNTPNEYNSKD